MVEARATGGFTVPRAGRPLWTSIVSFFMARASGAWAPGAIAISVQGRRPISAAAHTVEIASWPCRIRRGRALGPPARVKPADGADGATAALGRPGGPSSMDWCYEDGA